MTVNVFLLLFLASLSSLMLLFSVLIELFESGEACVEALSDTPSICLLRVEPFGVTLAS